MQLQARITPYLPQPLTGIATAGLAAVGLGLAWLSAARRVPPMDVSKLGLAAGLALAVVICYQYPIHLRQNTKVEVSSVAYFLMAVLLPPPVAATAAALGVLAAEVSVRQRRGTYPCDIASQVGRRALVVLLGAAIVHAGAGTARPIALVATALAMEVGDIVTVPLVVAPMCGDRPFQVMAIAARQAYLMEGAQYLLGVVGALAVTRQLWAVSLLALPTALVYLAFRAITESEVMRQVAEDARVSAETAQHVAEEARQVAEEALRVRDEFLTAASHDLRTPLTVVRGSAQLLQMYVQRKHSDDTWIANQLEALNRAASRMTATVEEITDTAQLQMGHVLALHPQPTDLGDLVRSSTEMVVRASKWPGAPPVIVDAADGIIVDVDRARMERVIQNVVDNAVKYSTRGTPVHVEVSGASAEAYVSVRDRGVGIPPAEIPDLFTHFYRASTSIGIRGTGIGLAGSKTIIEQHGGRIDIESVPAEGTTVTIALRLTFISGEDPVRSPAPEQRSQGTTRERSTTVNPNE